jgi:hypothetical protein
LITLIDHPRLRAEDDSCLPRPCGFSSRRSISG